jgi:hypothetical protein
MDLTLVPSEGAAQMTYVINDGPLTTAAGSATVTLAYDGDQLVQGHMALDFGTIALSFAIDPFSGTGEYQQLPYFMLTDPAVSVNCPGFWAPTSAGPAPILDVTLTSSDGSTTWDSTLQAALFWQSEECPQLPVALIARALTLTTQQLPDVDDDAGADFARRRAIAFAHRFGVPSPA